MLQKGAVQLDAFQNPLMELKQLFLGTGMQEKTFQINICQYQSALTFVSFGYKKDDCPETQDRHGPFQIHGITYHMQGPLDSTSDDIAQYAQLFFYDPAYATNLRHCCNPELDLEVLGTLTDMLHQVNPYFLIYKTAREQ